MPRKARVFIASSSEDLKVARAVRTNLESDAEVTVWKEGAFALGKFPLEALTELVRDNDFAVCVCAPTDQTQMRQQAVQVVRDNVIFEMGLFIGRYGRQRCFIVQPTGVELHLPLDVFGVTPGYYEPNRSDGNLQAAVGTACDQIREQILKQVAEHKDFREVPPKFKNIAVICYKRAEAGVELLLTRTSGGRWILPKGRRAKVESVREAVVRISREEAGAIGKVDDSPVGGFRYWKNSDNEEQMVTAFLLDFERTESLVQSFREPKWFGVEDAKTELAKDRATKFADEFRTIVDKAVALIGAGSRV